MDKTSITYNSAYYIEQIGKAFVQGKITLEELKIQVNVIVKDVLIPDLVCTKKDMEEESITN